MKTFRWCLPLFLAVAFWSCKNEGASFTPFIQTSYFYLNPVYLGTKIIGADDTLSVHLEGNAYVLDTIAMGDRVVFEVAYGSIGNELIACLCNFDTLQLDMQATLPEDFSTILIPPTDVRNLQLYIRPGINYVSFPIDYRPLQTGSLPFELRVESDSKFSPRSCSFIQPVR